MTANERLIAALDQYLAEHRVEPLRNIVDQFRFPSAFERLTDLMDKGRFEFPEVRMPVYVPPSQEGLHEYESATGFVDRLRSIRTLERKPFE